MHERRVALLMNRDSSHTREVCAGVLGYVAEGARWFVHLSPSDPRALEPLKEWQPDGVIAHLFKSCYCWPRVGGLTPHCRSTAIGRTPHSHQCASGL